MFQGPGEEEYYRLLTFGFAGTRLAFGAENEWLAFMCMVGSAIRKKEAKKMKMINSIRTLNTEIKKLSCQVESMVQIADALRTDIESL